MATIIPGLYGLDSATAWKVLSKDPNKYMDRFAKNKNVQKEIEYFNKKSPSFETVDDLMKDRRALQYLLDSYGLGSEINNAGRIKKILTEDPTDPNALVNKLVDNRFKTMANSLRLDQNLNKIKLSVSLETLEGKYIQNEFEEALGEQDTALRQAAYFARNVGGIENVYNLMGDQILRNVVTSTFNLPDQLAIQPIETQARVIAQRIDVTKLGVSNTGVSASQLTRAKADHTLISNALAVSDAALKQINALQGYLTDLSDSYANLDAMTDPNGVYADRIAIQQQSVPELLRYEALLNKGDNTLASVATSLSGLQDLIAQAKKSGADIDELKTKFNDMVASIHSRIDNAETTTFAGSENILLSGTTDPLTIILDDNGTELTIQRHDANALKDYLNSAATAFNAVTDSGDMTNLLAAEARMMFASESAIDMRAHILADKESLNAIVTDENMIFAASLNTAELLQGKNSVDDGLNRITQIESLLSQIEALAKTSKNLPAGADRTELESKFDDYKTQLRSIIENTSDNGLANFLNGIGDQQYEIIDGKQIQVKGGINLALTIADILDGASLSDPALAGDLETKAIMLTNQTDAAKASLQESKLIMDRAASVYDPRGKLDSIVNNLDDIVDAMLQEANVDGKNLLFGDQNDIRLDGLSSGNSLNFRAQPDFRNNFMNSLQNVVGQLNGDPSAIMSALYDLGDVVNSTRRVLTSDNRVGTMEQGKLGATIDVLDPKNTDETSKLYKTNAFTEKFLARYLTLAGSNGQSTPTSYLSNLFGGYDMASATANLMSLALSIKA